jgi:formylglycine-generating enzyme required for sulfatase activity
MKFSMRRGGGFLGRGRCEIGEMRCVTGSGSRITVGTMRLFILIPVFLLSVAALGGPAAADDWPITPPEPLRQVEMVLVKGGCYRMGDTFGDGDENEKPVHEVCVKDFFIGKYPVTQIEWAAVMMTNPSREPNCGVTCPVENVSWNDAQEFIRKLSQRTGKAYRLPTEAEWEYAARSGGTSEEWAGTSNESELGDYAWYYNNSGYQSHPVGQKKPNGLGLYDMTGNVWEWVSDWYEDGYYAESPRDEPQGAAAGRTHLLRGGYWGDLAKLVRVSRRIALAPAARAPGSGLRLAISAP